MNGMESWAAGQAVFGVGVVGSTAGLAAAQEAAQADGEAGGLRLESKANKWKLEQRVELVPHRCGARTCPNCGPRRGRETRQALLQPEKLGLFKMPYLLTLTVDPKRFGGPEEAHDYVTAGGYVRRLLRLLNINVWVWVLEFQQNGWPHWHILVDLSERGRLTPDDLRRCWRLWRDTWGLGILDLQERKDFGTADYAVMYITKYLTKPPKRGFPAWFLKGKRRRMVQGSQKVGRLTMGLPRLACDGQGVERRRDARPLVERMCECGLTSHVIRRWVDPVSGVESCTRLGEVEAPREDLIAMQRSGELPTEVGLVGVEELREGYTAFLVVMDKPGNSLEYRLRLLCGWLNEAGYHCLREDVMRDRRREFLAGIGSSVISTG